MSAFLCCDEHIVSIVESLSLLCASGNNYILKPFRVLGYNIGGDRPEYFNPEDKLKLAQDMLNLNYLSLYERYGDENKPHTIKYSIKVKKFYQTKRDLLQLIKFIDCFLYQSCEGEAEAEPLYQMLYNVKQNLCEYTLDKFDSEDDLMWEYKK